MTVARMDALTAKTMKPKRYEQESRNALQAAGPSGPRDYTRVNFETYWLYGRSVQRLTGATLISRATGFRTNRVLYANKISAAGKLLWGAGHAKVFSTGTLQLGNFFTFLDDGAGGAVFARYTSPLRCGRSCGTSRPTAR